MPTHTGLLRCSAVNKVRGGLVFVLTHPLIDYPQNAKFYLKAEQNKPLAIFPAVRFSPNGQLDGELFDLRSGASLGTTFQRFLEGELIPFIRLLFSKGVKHNKLVFSLIQRLEMEKAFLTVLEPKGNWYIHGPELPDSLNGESKYLLMRRGEESLFGWASDSDGKRTHTQILGSAPRNFQSCGGGSLSVEIGTFSLTEAAPHYGYPDFDTVFDAGVGLAGIMGDRLNRLILEGRYDHQIRI